MQTINLVLVDNHYHHNFCNAIWLDINNVASLVQTNQVVSNQGHGIVQEIGFDATITGNTVTDNAGTGILIRSSPRTIVSANTVLRDRAGGIYLVMDVRDDSPSDIGPHETTETQVFDNTISMNGSATEKVGGGRTSGSARGVHTGQHKPLLSQHVVPAVHRCHQLLLGRRACRRERLAGVRAGRGQCVYSGHALMIVWRRRA